MSFEQPSLPQETGRESIREDLLRKIEAMNDLQAKAAALDIDEIDLRPDAIDAQAHLMTDVFTAAEEHPEAFLEVAEQVKDHVTRRDLVGKAVLGIGARGDAAAFEGALAFHKEGLRSMGWEEELIKKDVDALRKDALKKHVHTLLKAGKIPEAVHAFVASGSLENEIQRDWILGPIAGFVKEGADARQKIERYRQLPDGFPEARPGEIAQSIYWEAMEAMPQDASWEERMAEQLRVFADAPDIIAHAALNRYRGNWEKEDKLKIFKAVSEKGERTSVLSKFHKYDFTDDGFEEVKTDLFEAYVKSRPDAILDRIDAFGDQFMSLPDAERQVMIDRWIEEKPETLVYRLGDALSLDDAQFKRLLDRIFFRAPERFYDPEFTSKLAMTIDQVADYAIATGKAGELLGNGSRALSQSTLERLANSVLETDPSAFLVRTAISTLRVEFNPEAVQKGLKKTFAAGKYAQLADLEYHVGARLDVSGLSEQDLRGIKLTDIGTILEKYPELSERLPMAGIIGKLEKIQARAARAEHDPWQQELDPLLAHAYQEGLLSPEKPADAELFLEFIKEFGAANTPKLLETYVGLKRAKTVEEIPADVRAMLEEALGKRRVEKMKTPAFLLNEVRKFDRGMVSALLEDEIPAGMTSELGLELFDQKKGASNWEQDDDTKELIGKWERFRKDSPERASVPEGYVETRMSVPLMARKAEGKEAKLSAILERPEVLKGFEEYLDRFRYWGEGLNHASEISRFIATHPEAAAFIEAARLPVAQGSYGVGDLAGMMEALKDEESAEAARLLARLSAEHARIVAPAGHGRAIWDLLGDEAFDAESVRRMRGLLVDYVSEHYLHPSQETHRTGHEPFSSELRAKLEAVWGLVDKGANPVLKAFNDIEALNRSGKTSSKSKEVALVPAQGILRIYGGDIGDACYTSRHNELAEGKYPDLHAMIFVTGRGTANERMAGSVLFVESETPSEAGGKKVLIVRANNPRENLVQEVAAGELVRQTLDAAIAIAKARGLDMVVVPLDAASTSSSNRPAVSNYYEERYGDGRKIPLARKAETNFNGYANWDHEGDHGVVAVWSREDEGKEPG